MTLEKQMKDDLRNLAVLAKAADAKPCEFGCPFVGIGKPTKDLIEHDCLSCYELFPGWGDFMLNENSQRSPISLDNGIMSCPCSSLDADFVSWRVNLFLEKGI